MAASDYQGWLDRAVGEYAEDKVKSGNWHASEALTRSAAEFDKYLPDGPATENAYIYSVLDEALGVKVGMIWFTLFADRPDPDAYIFNSSATTTLLGLCTRKWAMRSPIST